MEVEDTEGRATCLRLAKLAQKGINAHYINALLSVFMIATEISRNSYTLWEHLNLIKIFCEKNPFGSYRKESYVFD